MDNVIVSADQDEIDIFGEKISFDIYQKNAFRILQLSPQARTKEIQKRQQIIEISTRTGAEIPSGSLSIFALIDPPPDPIQISEAVQKLNDPQIRILEEVFWFWPDEDVWPAPSSGDPQELFALLSERWIRAIEKDPYAPFPIHNLAILNHVVALDLEQSIIDEKSLPGRSAQLSGLWKAAYQYWTQLSQLDSFWDELTRRIRSYDDPRLTTGCSRRIRSQLLKFITRSHAQLIVRQLEKDRQDAALRGIQVLRSVGIPQEILSETMKWAVEPVRQRLKSYPGQVKEFSDAELPKAHLAIYNLIERGTLQLNIIDFFLVSSDSIRTNAHDEFVIDVLAGIQEYFGRTDHWINAKSLVKKLEGMAVSVSTKEKMVHTNQAISEFEQTGNYWHAVNYYEQPPEILQPLERAHKLFQQGSLDQAIKELERIYNSVLVTLEFHRACSPAISMCYNQKAVSLLNSTREIMNRPRALRERIFYKIRNEDRNCLLTLQAISNGMLDRYGRMGMICCMGCGARIEGKYFMITFEKLDLLVCPICEQRDQAERDQQIREVTVNFSQIVRDLLYSKELNPANNLAQNNLKTVLEIAADLKIQVPTTSGRKLPSIKPPTQSVQPSSGPVYTSPVNPNASSKPVESQATRPFELNFAGLIGLIFIGIVLCLLVFGTFTNQNVRYAPSAPLNTVIEPSAVPAVVQPPPSTATLVPTPTQPSPTPTLTSTPMPVKGCFTTTTNVRSGPGTNFSVLGFYEAAKCVTVIGISPDKAWYYILAKTSSGSIDKAWAFARNVNLDPTNPVAQNLPTIP